MTIQAYRTQPFETTHENRIFDALLKQLEQAWGNSEDLLLLLGNFYCNHAEIDATVFTKNSIIIIDFKDFGGCITFSENGQWWANKVSIKGGSKPNPYIQIRTNKFALRNRLENINFPSNRQQNLNHISGLVLFHQAITFDERQLPAKIDRWFHIVDFDHIIERLSQITSREINLSNQDLECIVEELSIPEYIPIGSRLTRMSYFQDKLQLSPSKTDELIEDITTKILNFLESSDRILIITGMIGTGLEELLKVIVNQASRQGRNFSVLAPNRRIASYYPVEADSLYSYIYSGNPKLDKETFVYDLAENKATKNHWYIVGDAHLVSDSKFETDTCRYGTGQLLTDFLDFANLRESERQIIFLGDPFQLTRGKVEESALFEERLQAITGVQVKKLDLEYIIPEQENNILVKNCIKLAKSMQEGIFNELFIETDEFKCIEAPTDPLSKQQLLKNLFVNDPKNIKFVAYSHAEVNQINNWLRKNVFQRNQEITAGDIVQIHNSLFVKNSDELERPIYIPNDSFAEVLEIQDNVNPIKQSLKGREKPIIVEFIKVKVRLLEKNKEVEFLCLKNYLYAEKPEVNTETLLALYVSAKKRFSDDQSHTEINESNCLELTKFLQSDPYLNAARLRFGYALTLHRAQGQRFSQIVASMDTGQGQTNEAYFRWVYTLFSIVQDKIILLNIPQITPLYKAAWNSSQSQLGSIRPRDLIPFNPSAEAGNTAISEYNIPEKPLRNLYWYIVNNLQPQGIKVKSYQHHNYQEIYGFNTQDNQASCSLKLHYNKKFQVTQIETLESYPLELADQICEAITPIQLETKFQNKVYNLMKNKLERCQIKIQAIEHHNDQEIYYLKSEIGDVKLQLFYNKDGFITKVIPIRYSTLEVIETVKQVMEL